MNLAQLDYYFPFVVFVYGFVMTIILNSEFFVKMIENRIPSPYAERFVGHRTLGLICLVVGTFWSLQNLIIG